MLRIQAVVLEVLRMLKPVVLEIRKHDPDLADQLKRAASSVALNTSEGEYSYGRNVRARFDNALASAAESRACLRTAVVWEYIAGVDPVLEDKLDQVIATLYRLARR